MAKHLIIAGHGRKPDGWDPGAWSADGKYSEANLVRSLANKIKTVAGSDIDIYTEKDVFSHNIIGNFRGYSSITELHMNAFNKAARGVEVLIHSDLTPDGIDNRLLSRLAALFINRGFKKRSDLHNMNRAKALGMNYRLLETCFIDHAGDLSIYLANETDIARIIAEAITGKTYGKKGWVQHHDGRWWYRTEDGKYAKNEWMIEDGKYYFFDEGGYMVTGWMRWKNKWYFMYKDGVMATGWTDVNGDWFYMNPKGDMHTGWLQDKNKWYYLSPEKGGRMLKGVHVIGSHTYVFNNSGALISNR